MSRKISHSLRVWGCTLAVLVFAASGAFAQSRLPNAPASPPITSPRQHHAVDSSLGGAARLLSMSGQVSVLRDDIPWALSVDETVNPQQVVVTGASGYAQFQLADGSQFEVFPNSRVVFRNNAGNWRDLLDVLIGKVKVQIEKLGGMPNPNQVRTPTAVISVRGTVFDVDVEDDDATTLVLVEEGQVEVRHLLRGGDGRLLNPGEWIRVFKNQPIAAKTVDRGAVMQRAMRAGWDAIYQAMVNHAGSVSGAKGGTTGGGSGGTSVGVGDHCPQNNPNCTAPPPPPLP